MTTEPKLDRNLYLPVATVEDEEQKLDLDPASTAKSKLAQHWRIIAITAALLSVAFTSLLLFKPTNSPPKHLDHYDLDHLPPGSDHPVPLTFSAGPSPCGHSRSEALERGCIFDMLAYAWIPPSCYDKELTDEFQSLSAWRYFRQKDPVADEVSLAEAELGEHHHLFVTWEWHLRHCTYIWKRLQRASVPGGPMAAVDNVTASDAHTLHCERLFLKKEHTEHSTVNTRVRLKYADCVTLREL